MNIENLIKSKSKIISNTFYDVAENGIIIHQHYKINEGKLNRKYLDQVNITERGDFTKIFKAMQEYENYPALYFFEINPQLQKNEIVSLIKKVKYEYHLNIPASNNTQSNTGVLYVGKVKSCAWGRLIQHLGYHRNRKSHGLQLDYWVKKTSIQIDLSYHVFFLKKSMKDYMNIIEQEIAKSLKPIIGKH